MTEQESAGTDIGTTKKDYLVLAMLAALGGEKREVNERDLFLACWHAFPNAMRWVDTALPNPDTFTAALRRLDADGIIVRIGKQQRNKRKGRRGNTKTPMPEAGRSGVVKAMIREDGLTRARLGPDLVREARRLAPSPASYAAIDAAVLVAICVGLRRDAERHVDEGSLVETAFHKFPARFAYAKRPEFPDVEQIRSALSAARGGGLIDDQLRLTPAGKQTVERYEGGLAVTLDPSASHKAGLLKFADRIEQTAGYAAFVASGTLTRTKADELFRLLRVPPTTDPQPLAMALVARIRDLNRIEKGGLADYLMALAHRYNPEVAALIDEDGVLSARE